MDNPPVKRFTRKRKKSFITNAKKYGKKGCYGRGVQLEPDLYNYLIEIVTHFKQIENNEEKNLFVCNVFEQMENQEENCCYNQVGCRVIETLLPFASDSIINKFIEIISKDLRRSCTDTFASHVVETIFLQCYKKTAKKNNSELYEEYTDFVLKVAKFLLNNLEDFVWDTYANHIIRTVLQTFAMITDNSENKNMSIDKKIETESNLVEISDEYKAIIKDYAERIVTWPQFLDLAYNDLTSGLLQILIKSVAKLYPKLLKSYFKKLVDDCFVVEFEKTKENSYENELYPKPVIALLETFLQHSTSKIFTQIYAKLFYSKLAFLAKERNTNFAVQKLLDNCKEKTEFEPIFDELIDHLEEIASKQHTGVILSLGNACKRLSTKQGSFIMAIFKLFNCVEPLERQNSIVLCLSKWEKFEDITKNDKSEYSSLDKQKFNLHGTLLAQLLLNFNKPIKLVNSILSFDSNDLKGMFSNSMGCHIVDSYVKSPYVGEKSREKLIKKMQGTYPELVSSKYGSRSFDALWEVATLKMKLMIMNELSQKDASWSNSQFGRIIASRINLTLFKRNKEEWTSSLNKSKDKTKNCLIEIFK
ncbi:nucleolar protein 9 [Agrilus planipennis]|uniref:Nucleolar protein 9 n=1 Tax=Agrilus planipennis TaxID=224129 RepID=A0A1W4WXZ4_AGRPL|nr:nucleolar protein 9 [Agrilus planipennis]